MMVKHSSPGVKHSSPGAGVIEFPANKYPSKVNAKHSSLGADVRAIPAKLLSKRTAKRSSPVSGSEALPRLPNLEGNISKTQFGVREKGVCHWGMESGTFFCIQFLEMSLGNGRSA